MRNLEVTFNILGGSAADVPQSDQFIDRAHQNSSLVIILADLATPLLS